jgi:hypothetical protein
MVWYFWVHEEDPQIETSSSYDLLDPPQGLMLLVGWSMPTWVSVVAWHLHAHHLLNQLQISYLNDDLSE